MNSAFDLQRLWPLIWIGAAAALAKVIWVAVEWALPLPVTGVEREGSQFKHALHYRYRLASEAELKAPPKPKKETAPRERSSLSGYKLVGIYSTKDRAVVTLLKGNKSEVIASGPQGGEVAGYHLKEANATAAVFVRGNDRVTLKLYDKELPAASSVSRPVSSGPEPAAEKKTASAPKATSQDPGGIIDRGETKVISRDLIEDYTQNPDKIWKNIGLYEVKNGDKLDGFKVRFVRKGSPFEKLGLKRGDVIKAINGEPITDYAAPMRMLRDADTIDDLSLTIERNHEEQELKYEIQ